MNYSQLFKGTVLGMTAGLASTWIMTKAQTQMKALENKLRKEDEKQEASDPSTVQVADKLSQTVFHHPLPEEKKSKAGNIVHYTFGTSLGAAFGALTYRKGHTGIASGVLYGVAVWLFADNLIVPLLGFSKAPNRYPLKTHLYALGSHLVYGGSLALINGIEKRGKNEHDSFAAPA